MEDNKKTLEELVAPITNGEVEEALDAVHISESYISAACSMVALQILHDKPKDRPKTKDEFAGRINVLMRVHAPVAFSFFYGQTAMDNSGDIIPQSIIDNILEFLWFQPGMELYLGGKNSGLIIPGRF